MKKWLVYFNYVLLSIVVGVIIIVFAEYSNFISEKIPNGEYIQAGIYGLGYGVIVLGILKQKDEWNYYNDYPFKNFLMRFKFFQRKEEKYLKRKKMNEINKKK